MLMILNLVVVVPMNLDVKMKMLIIGALFLIVSSI
jgi:hypothetical protein